MSSPRRVLFVVLAVCIAAPSVAWADGKMIAPATARKYRGSVEERAQEAIILFDAGERPGDGREDLILKVRVEGNVERFAWVIPFPQQPTIAREDARAFAELFDDVQSRRRRPRLKKPNGGGDTATGTKDKAAGVEVLSRAVVGSYDSAVVREKVPGALNEWLAQEGFQPLADAEDVIGFYREKGYVFAAIKVTDAALKRGAGVDLHPLRFSFGTGGTDGIYFPMKMTGLQRERFDVNLYVFYGKWLNDDLSRYGYVHRGFELVWRDFDSSRCTPNAGKAWSAPETDPYLHRFAHRVTNVARLLRRLHPGERYYLTNIRASRLSPRAVRKWPDDLWLFPYYTNPSFIPFDARPGGAAAAGYPAQARPGRFVRPN